MNSIEFSRQYLRKHPKASFAEVRDAAKKKRIKLYPIAYGRAQALEGLITKKKTKKKSKRGPGRPKGSKNKKTTAKRGPGRPKGSRNKTSAGAAGSVEDLVSMVQTLQQERDAALEAIEKIRAVLP